MTNNSNRINTISLLLETTNAPKYRYNQISGAIYKQCVDKYSDITTISSDLRTILSSELGENILSLNQIYDVKNNQVHKVLFETKDKHKIESVLMTYKSNEHRKQPYNSICISSQSGCALKCTFCSTGAIGFKKNLNADEISDQILFFKQKGLHINTVSFMGMGEPLANPNVFDALEIITNKDLLGISQRKVNVSTVGIIPGIERLGQEYPNINLAFSLHSAFPEQRLELMPITKAYPIDKVMQAIEKHIKITKRKVFLAYILLGGINDSPEHAQELIKLINKQHNPKHYYHVNLIRFNSAVETGNYQQSSKQNIANFMTLLEKADINHTLRVSFGNEIDAACGQLYGQYQKS